MVNLLLLMLWFLPQRLSPASPNTVCVIGDVQANYDSSCDPRTLMGTYTSTQDTLDVDEQIVDTSAPIYEQYFPDTNCEAQPQYLFKIKNPIGWVFANKTLILSTSDDITSTVFSTCFEESLLDCGYGKWFWGYNNPDQEVIVETMHVLDGNCSGAMCLKNVTIQLKSDEYIEANPSTTYAYFKSDGEYHPHWDNTSNRYQWWSANRTNVLWYYRENTHPNYPISCNWVLGENNVDRIACAPGYVEMPLFCTIFAYAGGDVIDGTYYSFNPTLGNETLGIPVSAVEEGQEITTFGLGTCENVDSNTLEPTALNSSKNQCVSRVTSTSVPSGTPLTSVYPTAEDISSLERREDLFVPELNALKSLYEFTAITLACTCIMVSASALIDAKFYRLNDYFRVGTIFSMFIQTNDMISDCFFIVQIRTQNKIDEKIEYDVIFVLSIMFIVVPAMTALFQLYFHTKKHWLDKNNVRSWLSQYSTVLLLLSVFTGSSFAAVPLLNSGLFGLGVFDMGLTGRELKGFGIKRVYSIVLLENVPQIGLQSYYLLSSHGSDGAVIAISSIIFSCISIMVAVLTMALEKTIKFSRSYAIVTMNITGDCVRRSATKCRTMCHALRTGFAVIIGVDDTTLEILKPNGIKNGFTLKFYVYSNDKNSKAVGYKNTLNLSNVEGSLAIMVKEAWNLSDEPMIADIDVVMMDSKQQIRKDIKMLESVIGSDTEVTIR